MSVYLWTKSLHLLMVISWMAAVFYLPRILVNIAETQAQTDVRERLVLMGMRLYRFGHNLFGVAFVLGLLLWFGYLMTPDWWPQIVFGGWMHAKLVLVALLLAHFVWTGRMLKSIAAGAQPRSSRWLRWFNEIPVIILLLIILLVLGRPF